MNFVPGSLLARLDALETPDNKPDRYVIALSGGLDSTVLAHVLAATRDRHGKALLAVHVDHRLQPESVRWSDYCRELAGKMGIEFVTEQVSVEEDGSGLEAAARKARYAALARHVARGDWLLSAHHRNDQAETLLLNLMRGSGPTGLAGIGKLTPFDAGWLARPLIDVPRADLEAYAATQEISWVDDPSNEDLRFDRNFLRHDLLPVLEGRWPGAIERIARSADLAGEAATMLDELASLDLRKLGDRATRIEVDGLLELSAARQRNVLRYAIRRAGLPLPGAARLATVLDSVLRARADAQPLVDWPGGELRRYRGRLYLMPPLGESTWPADGRALSTDPLPLGEDMGSLCLEPGATQGLDGRIVERGLTVGTRRGGEEIRLKGQAHTKKLKKVLQEAGVVPWMRDRLPLVFAGERLVAVADLWLAADAAREPGVAVRWHERPELY